jgi:protein-disulfide isomerase
VTNRSRDRIPAWLRTPIGIITIVVLIAAAGLGLFVSQQAAGAPLGLVNPQPLPPGVVAYGRSLGNPDAPVKLDEWEDFQCPYCDHYTLSVESDLIGGYVAGGQLEITYHDFAFIGPESQSAAVAARCAGNQGQFWQYMEYLFNNQGAENSGTFDQALFDRIAGALKLDSASFDQCLGDPSQAAAVQAETNQGSQLGIQATPTLFINGVKYTGSVDTASIDAAIDAALKSPPSTGASPASTASMSS